MHSNFNQFIQIYASWGCGVIPLLLIWIINIAEISVFSKNNSNNIKQFKIKFKTIVIILLGLFISISAFRFHDNALINNGQSLILLSKFNIVFSWTFGLSVLFLIKHGNNIKLRTTQVSTCCLFSLVYIWQIACCTAHPVVLLICLEINLLLFLIICLENSFSENNLINILILMWMGAFASIFALLGLKSISLNPGVAELSIFWVAVLLLKFIVVPAQITLFGIYQRWTNYNLVIYLSCYYLPVLFLLLPLLTMFTLLNNVMLLLLTITITGLIITIITQFESTSSPFKTIAFSSLITLVILITTVTVF